MEVTTIKTLIKDINILTMDENRTRIESGVIAIENDTIIYVGKEPGITWDFVPSRTIKGRGSLAMPGFVNGHTHSAMTLFRGFADDLPLFDWLGRIWPLEDMLVEEDAYWLSLLSIGEMIQSGITVFSDMYMFMDSTARAVRDSGMRAVLARGLQCNDDRGDMRLRENSELFCNWHNSCEGRIKVMLGPHAIYTCSNSYINKCIELAGNLGAGIHIHVSETRREVEDSMDKYGLSPVMYMYNKGVFDVHTTAAHCVHLNDEDMDALKEKDVNVIHCPVSNLKLGSGIASVDNMLKKGINVFLGTDGAASNNNLCIMKEMNTVALMIKGAREDPTLVDKETALDMATINGAKGLLWDKEIGSLEEGKKADIILVDMDRIHYRPGGDWVSNLVYSGAAADVDTVMVNGRVLMENRELKTVDMDKVYYETNKIFDRIFK